MVYGAAPYPDWQNYDMLPKANIALISGMWVLTAIQFATTSASLLSALAAIVSFVFAIMLVCSKVRADRNHGWIKILVNVTLGLILYYYQHPYPN